MLRYQQIQSLEAALEEERRCRSAAQLEADNAVSSLKAELEGKKQEAELLRTSAGSDKEKLLANLEVNARVCRQTNISCDHLRSETGKHLVS